MLATLVIGLREGLEASLIVGIIAAFLKRTGKPLRPMWVGVAIAILLSIAVGVTLQLVSAALPQAAQEGMEAIIGLVAVTIVTGMIGWMNTHARNMRHDLEEHAAEALRDGTAWALVGMAFLAVLKEGFETSVFLLAAFQASTSVVAASAGAVVGILIAVGIGYGIFRGGVHLNLGRFFTITGFFLVLVAAGLVLTSLRNAHEAGWITIGQQQVIDLSWLAPNGSVQAALFTGVLGIPSDPRLIEVIGWLAFIVPTLAYLLWPAKRRPRGRTLTLFRMSLAGALVLIGAVLAAVVTLPTYQPDSSVTIASANGTTGTATLAQQGNQYLYSSSLGSGWSTGTISTTGTPTTLHDGVPTKLESSKISESTAQLPATMTLTQLVTMNGGRLPIGMSATDNPGPFTAKWTSTSLTKLWIYNGGFVDATSSTTTTAMLSGGGLGSSRLFVPSSSLTPGWHIQSSTRTAAVNGILNAQTASAELLLWKLWVPLALLFAALVLCGFVLRGYLFGRRTTTTPAPTQAARKENFA